MKNKTCICKDELNREKIWVHLGWCPLAPIHPKETWPQFWKSLDSNAKNGLVIAILIGIYMVAFPLIVIILWP